MTYLSIHAYDCYLGDYALYSGGLSNVIFSIVSNVGYMLTAVGEILYIEILLCSECVHFLSYVLGHD